MPITNADSLFVKGEHPEVGCLLVHAFAGVPINVTPIANIMKQYGFTVYAPVLKGHGTDIYDFEKATYQDWREDVKKAYDKLKQSGCTEVIVYGHSMGALLALDLAEKEPEIKAVLSFSAPIRVHDSSIYYQWRLPHPRFRDLPMHKEDGELSKYLSRYNSYPVSKQKDVCILMKEVERNLENIKCPILVLQSKKDELVRTKSAWIICERTNAKSKELILLLDSGHNFLCGPENEKIEKKIHSFLHNLGYKLLSE